MNTKPWKKINKCVVCGTKLVFAPSTVTGAEPEEGIKSCSHNHATFSVYGGYDSVGIWNLTFHVSN